MRPGKSLCGAGGHAQYTPLGLTEVGPLGYDRILVSLDLILIVSYIVRAYTMLSAEHRTIR